MKNVSIKIFITTFICCLSVVSAQASPFDCSPVKVKTQDKSVLLNAAENKQDGAIVYFFKNTSAKSIWLDHPNKRASASAGWSSYLQPGNWSALLLDKKEFELTCAIIEPGKVNYVSCEKSLTICAPAPAVINSTRKGSYWLVEDKAWNDFLAAFKKRVAK
ncbi:MAG: hypothetical protein P4M12_03160 [Gammaproteobacteria bacterium]|nr:hypothetical protein [Gammaproteobacteria bacterium]